MTYQDPRETERTYDTFHMGRSCMDLYSNDVGADFVHIKSFAAYVGGSPTNMSVGCRRLGLKSALLTAFGEDPVLSATLLAIFSPQKVWTSGSALESPAGTPARSSWASNRLTSSRWSSTGRTVPI